MPLIFKSGKFFGARLVQCGGKQKSVAFLVKDLEIRYLIIDKAMLKLINISKVATAGLQPVTKSFFQTLLFKEKFKTIEIKFMFPLSLQWKSLVVEAPKVLSGPFPLFMAKI